MVPIRTASRAALAWVAGSRPLRSDWFSARLDRAALSLAGVAPAAVAPAERDDSEEEPGDDDNGQRKQARVVLALRGLFLGLDQLQPNQVLSLLPFVRALSAADANLAVNCGRPYDLFTLGHDVRRVLFPPDPEDPYRRSPAPGPVPPLEALLDVFWAAHSPAASDTSAIFYHSAAQRDAALASRNCLSFVIIHY